jgi:polysaccharide export outer membrane protein
MKTRSPRLVWIALLVCVAGAAHAAGETSRSPEYDFLFPRSTAGGSLDGALLPPEIAPPLERPIDPQTYRMAPGDLLELTVGGETDRIWRLAISTEGMLLVPGSSPIDATGKSLAELVETVRAALSPRFPGKPINLHLLQPGAFRVPITGQVQNPGLHPLHAYDRVSAAISLAGGPIDGASIRQIVLTSPDGAARKVDLVRFALLGEIDQNPVLEPGVSIHVPAARDFVLVTGAVHGLRRESAIVPATGSRIPELPTEQLEWRAGDTARLAITRAGGLSQDADGMILLLRGPYRLSFDIAATDTVILHSGDVIEAAVRERWVYVSGAVHYPGPYPHLPSYKAADYVRLAGGPTQIGRGKGWTLRLTGSEEKREVGKEAYVPPGSTIIVPERWTYRTSTVLASVSGVTALIISLVALTK